VCFHGALCRAGRYASGHDEGYVSVLNPEDLPLLREALATATTQVTRACLLPRYGWLQQCVLTHGWLLYVVPSRLNCYTYN
jgi:hypothetical protein